MATNTNKDDAARARLRLHVLASGSKGNCSIIEDAASGACIAIDCGISWKAFRERCAECGVDPLRMEAILVTHEHTDHTKGLGVVTRGLARLGVMPALYASRAVHQASPELCAIEDACDLRHFASGDTLALGGMSAYAFPTSHDAAESFGFRVDIGSSDGGRGEASGNAGSSAGGGAGRNAGGGARKSGAIGFMTDTGIVTGEALEALANCRILAIEANHDLDLLEHGPYPRYLKTRIASDRGHLSNEQSAELLESLLCNQLECVAGMHVSQNNNEYRLPKESLAAILKRNDHSAQAFVGFQDRPISL